MSSNPAVVTAEAIGQQLVASIETEITGLASGAGQGIATELGALMTSVVAKVKAAIPTIESAVKADAQAALAAAQAEGQTLLEKAKAEYDTLAADFGKYKAEVETKLAALVPAAEAEASKVETVVSTDIQGAIAHVDELFSHLQVKTATHFAAPEWMKTLEEKLVAIKNKLVAAL